MRRDITVPGGILSPFGKHREAGVQRKRRGHIALRHRCGLRRYHRGTNKSWGLGEQGSLSGIQPAHGCHVWLGQAQRRHAFVRSTRGGTPLGRVSIRGRHATLVRGQGAERHLPKGGARGNRGGVFPLPSVLHDRCKNGAAGFARSDNTWLVTILNWNYMRWPSIRKYTSS